VIDIAILMGDNEVHRIQASVQGGGQGRWRRTRFKNLNTNGSRGTSIGLPIDQLNDESVCALREIVSGNHGPKDSPAVVVAADNGIRKLRGASMEPVRRILPHGNSAA